MVKVCVTILCGRWSERLKSVVTRIRVTKVRSADLERRKSVVAEICTSGQGDKNLLWRQARWRKSAVLI